MNGERKELFSEKVFAGRRTYFFDVKESADGTKYLVISESRPVGTESYGHTRVMVFHEHLGAFSEAFKKAVEFMGVEGKAKAHDVETIRREYPKAYARWTEEEDILLRTEYSQVKTTSELAELLQRKPSAIRSRLERLGLL